MNNIVQVIGAVGDAEIEPPVASNSSLPNTFCLVVLFCMQRRVADIGKQESHLLIKCFLYSDGSTLKRYKKTLGIVYLHLFLFGSLFYIFFQ